jgi:hypothetical protein
MDGAAKSVEPVPLDAFSDAAGIVTPFTPVSVKRKPEISGQRFKLGPSAKASADLGGLI